MSVPSDTRRPAEPLPSAGPDRVRRALAAHPDVDGVDVRVEVLDGRAHVVARVVPAARTAADDRSGEQERVQGWRSAYDAAYDESADAALGEDFGIWRDGVTGRPMPATDMHEWRDRTVERIRALRPRRLLDVGAGTGLLLRDLAPHCTYYHATDLSDVVVRRLRAQTAADPALADRVHVEQRAADDVEGLAPGYFDVVVLNSVVQYLPGGDHLEDVLRACFGLVAPGGHLFVGDVRNLALLRCARVVSELDRDAPYPDVLAALAEPPAAREPELAVDPDWFARLSTALGTPCTVETQLRRGREHNEMTRYRYDVTLSRTAAVADDRPVRDLRWGHEVDDVDVVAAVLATTAGAVRVTGVPNARLHREARAVRLLEGGGDPAAARRVLDGPPGGVEPEELWALGDRGGRDVRVRWSHTADGLPDTMDVVVAAAGSPPPVPVPDPRARPLVGDPAAGARDRVLVAGLRRMLADLLPDDDVVVLLSSPTPGGRGPDGRDVAP